MKFSIINFQLSESYQLSFIDEKTRAKLEIKWSMVNGQWSIEPPKGGV
jgi:hypothetical protein